MDILAAMDRFAYRSGLVRLTMIDRPRPRSLRWLPLFVLVGLAVGYPLMLQKTLWPGATGAALFWSAYLLANYLLFLGPRLVDDARKPLDERERLIKARTGAVCGAMLGVAAIFFCFYQAAATLLGWPRIERPLEWFYFGLGLQGAWMTLPVMVASWIEPRLSSDEEA